AQPKTGSDSTQVAPQQAALTTPPPTTTPQPTTIAPIEIPAPQPATPAGTQPIFAIYKDGTTVDLTTGARQTGGPTGKNVMVLGDGSTMYFDDRGNPLGVETKNRPPTGPAPELVGVGAELTPDQKVAKTNELLAFARQNDITAKLDGNPTSDADPIGA